MVVTERIVTAPHLTDRRPTSADLLFEKAEISAREAITQAIRPEPGFTAVHRAEFANAKFNEATETLMLLERGTDPAISIIASERIDRIDELRVKVSNHIANEVEAQRYDLRRLI